MKAVEESSLKVQGNSSSFSYGDVPVQEGALFLYTEALYVVV